MTAGALSTFVLGAETADRSIRTLRSVPEAINDTRLLQVVRVHLHLYDIPHRYTDEVLAQLPRDMGENLVPILELYSKHCAWKHCYDFTFYFYGVGI